MVLLIMGVAGSGKTTVGRALSDATAIPFLDADDYHPPENVAKMRRGEPLADEDRRAWLAVVRERIDEAIARGESTIVACSALKAEYRTSLGTERPAMGLVYLHIGEEVAQEQG
jgi:gluconokinase